MDSVLDNNQMTTEVEECRKIFETKGAEECRRFLKVKQEEWKTSPLNIAVIGNSGVGKSSFINAIRRLDADAEGAAAVGVTECTSSIGDYAHPNNPLLRFWDLPGVGTDKFPKATYLNAINVDSYDFFLLLSATRFTEYDVWLGNEIRNRNKKYFYIRTKIGADISNDKKAHPRTHKEPAVLNLIRQSTTEHLKEHGSQNTQVFLVDNYKPLKFDFEQLEQSLIREFPVIKRQAMIMSMCSFSEEMIKVKVAELRSRIWKDAVTSVAALSMTPLPGMSVVFDNYIVKHQFEFYFTQLGLDDKSLQQQAILASIDFEELKEIVNKTEVVKLLEPLHLVSLATCLSSRGSSTVLDKMTRYAPFIGDVIVAPVSLYNGTCYMLNCILDHVEKVAYEVIRYCAEHAANDSDDDD